MHATRRAMLVGVAAVAVATVARMALDPVLGDDLPFLTYFAAVIVAGWWGGLWPAVLTATLSYVAAVWFFIPPRGSLAVLGLPVREAVRAGSFVLGTGLIAVVAERMRRVQLRIVEHRRALEREIAERERAESGQWQLAAIVESSEDAIVGKDLDGVVRTWNRAAERMFGYTAAEMIGQPIATMVPPERRAESAEILDRIRAGERVDHFETERLRKDGTRIQVSLTVSPIHDPEGAVVGASKIARDVSERRRADREREDLLAESRAARADAEASSRAKDAFLATISHELRTPLSPILSWARMLREKRLPEDKVEHAIEVIERSAAAQAQLIDDLLDVSRIVSGKLRLEVRPTALATVIQQAADIVRPAADAKGVRLQLVIDSEVGPVAGDPERLQQVVWNLLSNAIRFTPRGGRVSVTLERVNSHVEIVVADTGQGISPEFLGRVFERFQQEEGGTARLHGGLGLGLAIARHLVEGHGGSIHAESPGLGGGAVFTVKLPLMAMRQAGEVERRHPTASDRPQATPGAYPSLAGLRILVVDDEPDSSEAVSALLRLAGAEVRAASSAAEARDLLERFTADMLVSDVGMPAEDGYAFITALRRSGRALADLPAIALTAYASREDRIRLLSSGFQAHVPKPLHPTEFLTIVHNLARTTRRLDA